MNDITGLDQAYKRIGKFKWNEFRIIRELRFYEMVYGAGQNIDLVVESEDRHPNYQLRLTFCDVSGLKLDDFGGGQTRIMGLEIVNITEKQWDGINWEVLDFENKIMEFRSKTAEIVSVIELA
jgi:hypothetical protein